MKLPKQVNFIRLGLFITACLALTSCGERISPPETKQSQLDWNLKTLVNAYQDSGNTDTKWDEAATRALTEFARSRAHLVDANENWVEIIGTNCAAAIEAGCDDPMIRYLYIRNYMSQTNSPDAFVDAFCKMAEEMQQSSYPSVRKFYASLRALEQVYYANRLDHQQRPTGQWAENIVEDLTKVVADKNTPPQEVYEACSQGLHQLSGSKDGYLYCYNQIEQPLFANWPKESVSWLVKGEAHLQMAWQARGGGYADNVTSEGWKLFREHLTTAESSLKKAWQLNPTDGQIPTLMIRVDEGQQKSREDMELWFTRAMLANPDNYDACKNKLHYLYPQWYGSRDEMIAFGKECVASNNWRGFVPLILVDAHTDYNTFSQASDEEKQAYWKQPGVWPDIKAAYDRFFELNPSSTGIFKNYAWYAYHAEQWDAFNQLAPKVRPMDYNFFGGKDEFDKMVRLAKERAKPSAASQ